MNQATIQELHRPLDLLAGNPAYCSDAKPFAAVVVTIEEVTQRPPETGACPPSRDGGPASQLTFQPVSPTSQLHTDEEEILVLLGHSPLASPLSSEPVAGYHSFLHNHNALQISGALPHGFRRELERRWKDGRISTSVARYYLNTLAQGDSKRVPGQGSKPSLLKALLTEDIGTLAKEKPPGQAWRPLRTIGRGAYGSVILWERPRKDAPPLRIASKDSLCSSFFRDYCSEAQLTRRLNDKGCNNVINVVEWAYIDNPRKQAGDVGTEPRHRIAYEYAEHSDLRRLERWYKSRGLILPEAFIWHILYSVANALCYCRHGTNAVPHNQAGWDSIVHGDIKQDNLFMTAPDSKIHHLYPRLKLADFGLAYTLGGSVPAVQYFKSMYAYGTEGYIAPEINDQTPEKHGRRRMPHELHGPHSDIYSLGMTCKNLMSLVQSSKAKSTSQPAQDFHAVAKSNIAIKDPCLEDLYSEKLREIVNRCIAKDSRDRPKTFRLYQESRTQMEWHRNNLYAGHAVVNSGISAANPYGGQVLYSKEDQVRYEADPIFRGQYQKTNLEPLWALVAEQKSRKPVIPQTHRRPSSKPDKAKGDGGQRGGEKERSVLALLRK